MIGTKKRRTQKYYYAQKFYTEVTFKIKHTHKSILNPTIMKKLNRITLILISLFFVSLNFKAQICPCPYKIVNTGPCPVSVSYKAFDGSCNNICSGNITLVAITGVFVFPTGCCNTIADVEVVVTTINAIAVNFNSTPCYNSGGVNSIDTGFYAPCTWTWTVSSTCSITTIF